MSGGLVALLDDIAALARAAAASVDDVAAAAGRASGKAVGVVVDDTAVTPQYLEGVDPARELPMIWRIARGSLINKLVIILPIALLLSEFLPWALTPLLMLGGSYLCFEGMEKVIEKLRGGAGHGADHEGEQARDEDTLVKAAIFTDLILSAEIMVISLNEVADETFWRRAIIMVIVGIAITAIVYGVVALLVKMDDIGLRMVSGGAPRRAAIGRGLVAAMPKVLTTIGVVGTLAMLWVGGHIMVVGLEELGFAAPYDLIHGAEVLVPAGFLAWMVNTALSLVAGAIWGAVLAGLWMLLPWGHGRAGNDDDEREAGTTDTRDKPGTVASGTKRAALGGRTPGAVGAGRSQKTETRSLS
ncbi:MAG: DUF808 domain-containing protein [Micrococcaceae bacterium]